MKENKKLDLEELEEVTGGKVCKKVDKSQPGWYFRVSIFAFGQNIFIEDGPFETKEDATNHALVLAGLLQISGETPEITYEEVTAN